MLAEETGSVLSSSPELLLFDHSKLAGVDEAFKLFFVALLDAISPHGVAHSSDNDTAHLESDVHVVDGSVGHVTRHPHSGSRDHVELVLQVGGELVNTTTQEEVVVFTVEAALFAGLQKVGGYVQCMQLRESCLLERLSNGVLQATGHRVVNTPWQRYSMVLFFALDGDFEVAPLPQFTGPDSPARYQPVTQDAHIARELKRAYDNLNPET